MSQDDMLKALLCAHSLLERAKAAGAFVSAGGDYYIQRGVVDKALCESMGLDYATCKTVDFERAIELGKLALNIE